MNTHPNAKKILCFGDSNTWGQKPDKSNRYAPDVRWTGQLQELLGGNYDIIEEGLGGRTTDLNYSKKTGRNGRAYLEPCLDSHAPLDYVALMLGTNDLKSEFNRSVDEIVSALDGLVELIREKSISRNKTHIILVSPILIDDTAPRFAEFYTGYYDHDSVLKSKHLAEKIKILAERTECGFVDASEVAETGEDGIHFTEESHRYLGEIIAKELERQGL